MKKESSITKNYMYNLCYQIFLLIVPIAVTPYVARVLGENGSGQYAFSHSINYYFILVANLGFNLYAQRLIAAHQGDKRRQSIDFFEIIISRTVPVAVSLAAYCLVVFTVFSYTQYIKLLTIMIINIISVEFDITFFFQGNEEFGRIVKRNIIIKLCGFICIFVFVNNPSDLWKYALIQSLILLLSAFSLWLYIPKYICRIRARELHPLRHLPATFLLFLPTIATSVYTVLDKTLIGIIVKNDAEIGNYEYAERLVKMALTVVTSLGTVIVPKNALKFELGDLEGVRKNINLSSRYILFLGCPLCFGAMAISDNLIPWYLGEEYIEAVGLMKLLAPLIVIIGMSNVFGIQYLIPSKQDRKYTAAILTGTFSNLILNLLLIKTFRAYGAAFATIIAELLVTAVMGVFVSKDIDILLIVKNSWRYLIVGGIMFIPCSIMSQYLPSKVQYSIVIVAVGILIYSAILFCIHDFFVVLICNKIKSIFRKDKKNDL